MSGFVAGFGKPDQEKTREAAELIRHRGPHASGAYAHRRVLMIQHYLRADGPAAAGGQIPRGDKDLRLCYDGQMGDGSDPAARGADCEEDAVLAGYREDGTEMFKRLGDAIFALVISDGEKLLAARDLLGIKTLFYGKLGETIYLASELKSITRITDQVFEFPPGHYLTEKGEFIRFAELPPAPDHYPEQDPEKIAADLREIITRSIQHRLDFSMPTASLLSGGIDSSVICALASRLLKKLKGPEASLKTFSLGLGASEDIKSARLVAEHLGTEHHEVIVKLDQLLEVLHEVIYHLEHFDPSLVRSAASNYIISRAARDQGIELLLSGEGGDEIFCGYNHMKSMPAEEMHDGQVCILEFIHHNASLRLDRMNQCHSIKVVTPLISGRLLDYSLKNIAFPLKMRQVDGQMIEKWIFRKAFEQFLPQEIVWRVKQEFSQGSGSAAALPGHFEKIISDQELDEAQKRFPLVRSKEELHYFRIFTEHFGEDKAVATVGQWLTL